MPNEYSDLLKGPQPAGAAPQAPANPYLEMIRAEEDRRKAALNANLSQSVTVNPDQYNAQRRVAGFLGYPVAAVEARPEETNAQAATRRVQQDTASNTTLQRKYTDADFAKLAHDDSGPLSSIGSFLKDSGSSVVAGLYRASKGAAGTFRAGAELFAPLLDPLAGTIFPENPLRRVASGFAELGAGADQTAKYFTPKTDGVIASGVQSGIQSLTQNALMLPMAIVNPAAALTGMSATAGGEAYQDARKKLPMSQALPYAVSQAAIEYATEKIPLGKLIGDVKAGTGVFKTLVNQVAREIPGEQVATVLQDLNEWAVLNPEKPFSAYLAERPSAAAQTLVATIVGAGGNVALVKGIEAAVNLGAKDAQSIAQAEGDAQRFTEMLRVATESKLRERSPETFADAVQSMANETTGAPTAVYIDGEVLAQALKTMPPEDLQRLLPSVPAQLAEAVATGGAVEIPIGEAMAAIPGSSLEQVFLQNVRTAPDALSMAEAKAASEKAADFLKQEADRIIAQAQDQEALQASAEVVKKTIVDQLNTAGRFRPEVNEAYATLVRDFYTTMSSRAGMTPEQMYQRYPLRVAGAQGQGDVLNADQTRSPNFLSWFKKSKIVNAQGQPQVMYHGTAQNISSFKGKQAGAIFVSPDQKFAGEFAGRSEQWMVDNADKVLQPEQIRQARESAVGLMDAALAAANSPLMKVERDIEARLIQAGKKPETKWGRDALRQALVDQMPSGQNVMPVFVQAQNPFDFENKAHVKAVVDAVVRKTTRKQDPFNLRGSDLMKAISDGQWQAIEEADVQAAIRAAGFDSFYVMEKGVKNLGVYQDTQIKSVFNDGGFDPNNPDVLQQRGAQPARRARPIPPQIAAAADVGNARTIAASRQWPTNRDFKLAIQNAVRAVMGQRDLRADTPENRAYVTQQLLKEAREALVTNSNAIGWYDEKVTTALEVVSTIHPELKTDEQAKFAFIWALAVTSNGVKVDKNFELAERSYRYWKDNNGRLPTSGIGVGPTASKIHDGLRAYNTLIERWGFERLQSFATTLQPNRDVVAAYGRKVSGEGMDTQVYGAGILGPKIGNGFFMNLYGEFGQLTMDRWWVRMWGRITGDLVEIDPQGTRAARDAFVSLIDIVKADRQALRAVEQAIGAKLNKGNPVETAKAIIKATSNEEVRDALKLVLPATPEREAAAKAARSKLKDFVSIGDELRKAAKSYYGYLDGQIEVPGGSRRRDMMREVSQAVLVELQKDNPSLTMADFQALMWYPEKTLYDSAGAQEQDSEGYDDDEAPDYANAAVKLARDQGISDADINAAVERARSDIASRQRAGRSGRGSERVPAPSGDGARADTAADTATGEVNGRLEQAGNGAGRGAGAGPAPLPGAPVIAGATGPDPRLVTVAEQYARDNGIDLKRQSEYVQVDPERAARIAAAYEAMPHAPQDPAVKEAYENLIAQTVAQYRALEAAGYKFWFIDPTNDPYKSPWDAMREMRANQTMGVFPTVAGFGSGASAIDVSDNLLMGDTGIQWPYGSVDGELKPVLANDLFRAVHDAFGHGLEGAGFRAQGEENAWQAHARLFTGSAIGAITSETRGQNSWLNFGPYGETNRTAKVEDTVFADQKTGLMPEWTWTEGRAGDMPDGVLEQGPRGTFSPSQILISLSDSADLSTFLHESGHFFLEVMADIASRPDAPQQIKDDMATAMKWFGVPDLATWNGYTLEEKRPYHEKWAESFEQYLIEGKAPSAALQPLFHKFRAWMLNVYKSLQKFLAGRDDLKLSPEVRLVFDRMLANEEEIAQAEQIAGLMPDEEASAEALDKLNARSMRDLKWAGNAVSKAIAKLQSQANTLRKEIKDQVTEEVNQQPVYAVQRWIKTGVLPDGTQTVGAKISTGALKEMYGDDPATPRRYLATNLVAEDGMHPDIIADMFGFESGDAMVRAIVGAEPIANAIDGITDQRMLEQHGDLVDERAVRDAAIAAVHNEARAKSLATELKAQQEMLGQRTDTGRTNAAGNKITVNALLEAAKQFGANVVARTPLRDLKATAWKHTAAERRAGKRWQEATAAGKTEEAVKAKQDQVLNNAAAKAAMDAMAEGKKIVEFFRDRVAKGNNEKVVDKGRDPDIVNAARAVLAAYGLTTPATKGAVEYLEKVKQHDPDTWSAIEPIISDAMRNAQPLEALTFEELRGLHEAIQSLWFLAKRSRQMEVDGDMLDIEDLAGELNARMQEIGIPDTVPGETGAMTKAEERGRMLQFAGALLRRVEQWAEAKDGKYGGPFLNYIFQPVKDAADRYRADRVVYRKKFQALVDAVAPSLRKGTIEAPELGYTFGRGHNGIGHAELLHAILHTGNDSNKRKLLLGRGWATDNGDGTLDTTQWDAFLQRMYAEGVLTQVHYDFAQGVWDLLEETKPLAQKTHRDVFGRYFDEVTANTVVTPFGTYRGGYVPAQADPRIVQDAELRDLLEGENASMAYAFPSTNRGFTKGRVEYNRPLMLDLRTIGQHLDKVLLFAHMEPHVRDVARLIKRPEVSQPLGRIDPAAISGMLRPWLNRSARQIVETPIIGDGRIARMASIARSRAGMSLMFANISNTIQQITGLSTAAVKVSPSHLMRATANYIAQPRKASQAVWDASPYMADRASNEVAAMSDLMDQVLLDPNAYQRAQAWTQKHAYFLQTAFDNVLSPIVWTAAYNQAIEEGTEERLAVRYADGVVRQTQGSTLPEDVSRIETGPAYARLFTQFIGYFNMMANTNATALKNIAGEMGLKKGAGKALYVVAMGLLTPIWVAEAIALAFKGGPDDEDGDGWLDDWMAAVFGMGTIKGTLAQVPFVGQLGQVLVNRFNDNPADDKFSLSPAVSILESAVGAPVSVYKAIMDDGNAQKAIRDVASLVSIATGLPVGAVARPLGYAAAVEQGKADPTGPVDAARGLITGVASPASK